MKIVLVRHGETENNLNNIIQGRTNSRLSEAGIRQARKLRGRISKMDFDACYTSSLARSVETAMILIGDRVKMITDDRIIERGMGELEGKERGTYNHKLYWDYELNCSDYGVESIKDLVARAKDFYNFILDKYDDNSSILIVTHGAFYRVFRHLLLNHEITGDLFDGFISNCQMEIFDIHKKKND